jgi:hypothetical protein
MGINDLSVCVYVWIKRQEYVTMGQLYIEPLVYKNKSIYIYMFPTSSSRPQLTRVALFIQ